MIFCINKNNENNFEIPRQTIELKSSEAYLRKLGKNLSWDFEAIFIFRKNEVLNICRYLKSFYTYKKINNIFLKFHHYLLRMQKIVEIG